MVLAIVNPIHEILVGDDRTFRIGQSGQYGYVHHYGIYDNHDLLNFSTTEPAAHFSFRSDNTMQEMSTGKCVARLTSSNYQLILVNCTTGPYVDTWKYDSTQHLLIDLNIGWCWSPWSNSLLPHDIGILAGLSPCDGWNEIILEYGGCFRPVSYVEFWMQFKQEIMKLVI